MGAYQFKWGQGYHQMDCISQTPFLLRIENVKVRSMRSVYHVSLNQPATDSRTRTTAFLRHIHRICLWNLFIYFLSNESKEANKKKKKQKNGNRLYAIIAWNVYGWRVASISMLQRNCVGYLSIQSLEIEVEVGCDKSYSY